MGDWVKVRSYEEILETLSDGNATDGLEFVHAPMRKYCGRKLRVVKVIKHFYDESKDKVWRKRRAGTVLLEAAGCDSSQLPIGHCDRGCLLFWNEKWLERTNAPACSEAEQEAHESGSVTWNRLDTAGHNAEITARGTGEELGTGTPVRVLSAEQIRRTLDQDGTCEGIHFVPEHMDVFCGSLRIVSGTVTRYYDERDNLLIELECGYTLSGATCSGIQGDGEPTCDRLCSLVWHRNWLEKDGLIVPASDAPAVRKTGEQ